MITNEGHTEMSESKEPMKVKIVCDGTHPWDAQVFINDKDVSISVRSVIVKLDVDNEYNSVILELIPDDLELDIEAMPGEVGNG